MINRVEMMQESIKGMELAAFEDGQQQGLEQGLERRSVEVARNMKADGDSTDKIARNTGLSYEQVLAL